MDNFYGQLMDISKKTWINNVEIMRKYGESWIFIYFYGYDVEIIFENMDISMDISIYFYEQNMIFFSTWMFL